MQYGVCACVANDIWSLRLSEGDGHFIIAKAYMENEASRSELPWDETIKEIIPNRKQLQIKSM